jgi:hypothetical protein
MTADHMAFGLVQLVGEYFDAFFAQQRQQVRRS